MLAVSKSLASRSIGGTLIVSPKQANIGLACLRLSRVLYLQRAAAMRPQLVALLLHLLSLHSHLAAWGVLGLVERDHETLGYDLLAADEQPAGPSDNFRQLARRPESNLLIGFGLPSRPSGDVSRNTMPQQDDRCPRRCQRHELAEEQVCASNGRLFGSICELRRFSCRHNMHLIAKPLAYCSKPADQARLVKLEKRCNRLEYERMKLLLLLEFNGDPQSLFNYLDSNSDRLLEAHELWPKTSGLQERLIYAQLWSNHLADCPRAAKPASQAELAEQLEAGRAYKQTYHFLQDHSKCWYLLDFAFEPHYPPNPCSLSHLILFEAANLSSLGEDAFKQAFALQLDRERQKHRQNHLSAVPIRGRTPVGVALGASVELSCLANLTDQQPTPPSRCIWTRYNTNLASLRQPHVMLDGVQSSILRIQEAQLYLSGPYKCACHFDSAGSSPWIERYFELQVLAEPHVEIRPELQWSLAGSSAAFECLYDYFDTRSVKSDANHDDQDKLGQSADDQMRIGLRLEPELALNWSKLNEGLIEPLGDSNKLDRSSLPGGSLAQISGRAHLSIASSRLTLENLSDNDSGSFVCSVGARQSNFETLWGQAKAQLKVQARPEELAEQQAGLPPASYLWVFHENGISVYRLPRDDGQEMELAREITGHSQVDANVDGNWNQLTLCGGLNPDQVVICEWSDNALHLDVDFADSKSADRRYIYVGQPNLNRVVVLDGKAIEIVAIINTEPQPRKLFLYKPNRVHLSKWVRRRLSPSVNARWLKAAGSHAHPLEVDWQTARAENEIADKARRRARSRRSAPATPSKLLQLDIWLLCYGQPLVLDPEEPASDERAPDESAQLYLSGAPSDDANRTSWSRQVLPFTPRIGSAWASGSPQVWPNSKESRLRNRKSVHIIQSTFFADAQPAGSRVRTAPDDVPVELESETSWQQNASAHLSALDRFKRFTVLTSHHILAGSRTAGAYFSLPPFDLVQELMVPARPRAFSREPRYQVHHAYVSHYDERRLFRVSMDEYRYEREIDLQDCDPLSLLSSAQGLLVVQCRAPITHQLIGQLVLDQLTSARLEFNANIRAQESFISPDNRYLLSIYTNYSSPSSPAGFKQGSSLIYVQRLSASGLLFQYQIKSTLEIMQCAFVWRDGYYAAILVSSNHQEEQSELLSLRLADSRLELLARVPGTVSQLGRRKDQLLVADELRLAALATNRGTFVVDLEDNRVSQSLRHHQSPPTMLWV